MELLKQATVKEGEKPPTNPLEEARALVLETVEKQRYGSNEWLKFECKTYQVAKTVKDSLRAYYRRKYGSNVSMPTFAITTDLINKEKDVIYLWVKRRY